MLTITLDDTLEQALNVLVNPTGKTINQYIKDLILEQIEDAEDAALGDAAMDRLMRGESTTVPYSEVKRRLHELDN
jgi:predicted DNA-binding protein